MKIILPSIIAISLIALLFIPSASAVPYVYNTTAISLPYTTTLKNSSSYDVFLNNVLGIGSELKWNNNTNDVYNSVKPGTITYNTNLKAFYKFNSTITDSTTNARTLTKAAGTQTFVTGEEDNATSLDAATYYTASDTGMSSGNAAWSVESWVYVKSLAGDDGIMSWGTAANNQGISVYIHTDGHIYVDNWTGLVLSSIGTVSTNTWTDIAVTYDGTTLKIYKNGVLDTSTNPAAFGIVLSGAVGEKVGAYLNAGAKCNCNLDEVRFYNTGLSSDQVKGLYMVGKYKQSHEFDGGEIVSLGNVYNFDRTDQWTYAGWIKTTQTGKIFFAKYNGVGMYMQVSSNHLDLTRRDSIGNYEITIGSTNIADGNWHHIVVENNGTGKANGISMWVDKVPESITISSDNLASSIANSANTQFGDYVASGFPFAGQLDDTYIIPGIDLSQTQINSIYNGEGFTITSTIPNNQITSWYHGVNGSSTLTKVLGTGLSSLTLACNVGPAGGSSSAHSIGINGSNLYYMCDFPPLAGPFPFYRTNVNVGGNTLLFHAATGAGSTDSADVFVTKNNIFGITHWNSGASGFTSIKTGNTTFGSGSHLEQFMNNQRYARANDLMYKYYYNGTAGTSTTGSACELLYQPTNATRTVDSIVCDLAFPANSIRYWQGMLIQGQGLYYTNSTQQFLNSIDANTYKHLLSLPCPILGLADPCVTMILQDGNNVNWFVGVTSTKIYYNKADTLNGLINQHRAWQSYDMINTLTDSTFGVIPTNSLSFNLYGFSTNTTIGPRTGLFSIPSGYHFKSMTSQSAIRDIDPQWTNGATDLPVIFTSNTIFPVYLTVSNAPTDSALMATNGGQVINSQEAIYAVSRLDGTRSVELDLPPAACVNTYVADISVAPTIWNYEGQICATGANTKTIAYASTLPLSFYTLKYGASSSYNPTNNGLTTSVRSATTPLTYTVTIKNSTGAVTQTYTTTVNATLDTHVFNVTNASKPASIYVTVPGGSQIYSSYLGSPLSLASTAAFFHQYLSYQGFDLLSFIPIIFASMFTRNTVGAGMALTVVVIASLSWLSVVVIPDTTVYIAIVIACIGIVGYRGIYG